MKTRNRDQYNWDGSGGVDVLFAFLSLANVIAEGTANQLLPVVASEKCERVCLITQFKRTNSQNDCKVRNWTQNGGKHVFEQSIDGSENVHRHSHHHTLNECCGFNFKTNSNHDRKIEV